MNEGKQCPECRSENIVGVEYAYGSPERFDGCSEWLCGDCGYREGRWTGKELTGDEIEPRYGIDK